MVVYPIRAIYRVSQTGFATAVLGRARAATGRYNVARRSSMEKRVMWTLAIAALRVIAAADLTGTWQGMLVSPRGSQRGVRLKRTKRSL